MNSCNFTGRLTKDIEVKYLDNEKKTKYTFYSVAVQDDFDKKKAHFPSFQSFGKDANYLEKYGKKGMYIEIENAKATTYIKDKVTHTIFVPKTIQLIFSNSKDKEEKVKETKPKSDNNNENSEENPPF
jgi:single-stranded DNA-binding protein